MELIHTDREENVQNLFTTSVPENLAPAYIEEIERLMDSFTGETPSRVHLEDWTGSRFQNLLKKIPTPERGKPEIRIGYSVKTSPTDAHLAKAKQAGFYIECISQMEVHKALMAGVRADEIILNGPGKFWPITKSPVTGLHMLFCDSIEEFERALTIPNLSACLGARIQLPRLPSRFGIAVDEFEKFEKLVACVKKLKGKAALAFHFHMPSWAIGMKRWNEALHSLLIWCQSLEQITKMKIERIDLGGGFFPADFEALPFAAIQDAVKTALPHVEGIYFEPGRSLTQEGEVVFSRVLDVRRSSKNDMHEVVVDACVAELPLIQSYPHRIFYKSNHAEKESGRILSKGKTKILGRICMENDVLSRGLNLPNTTSIGDFIVFGDAGAYERTMSYDFGRG
jgi:diaminopimelate decarboxylase